MIDWPERLALPNLQNKRAFVDLNWNEKIKGRFLRITVDGKSIVIPRESFISAALLLGSEDEQEKLIPTVQIPIRRFEKRVKIRLTKDLRTGDEIEIPVTFDVRLDTGNEVSVINNSLLI